MYEREKRDRKRWTRRLRRARRAFWHEWGERLREYGHDRESRALLPHYQQQAREAM